MKTEAEIRRLFDRIVLIRDRMLATGERIEEGAECDGTLLDALQLQQITSNLSFAFIVLHWAMETEESATPAEGCVTLDKYVAMSEDFISALASKVGNPIPSGTRR